MTEQIDHSARAVNKDQIEMAKKAFEEHHLIRDDRENGLWRIARKYEDGSIQGNMATEVISLWGGRLFVGGDIQDCTFGYYSGGATQDTKQWHEEKLCWMGRCCDVGYYVLQKACIGMGDGGKLTEVWDPDVARHQLLEHLNDEEQEWSEKDRDALTEALTLVNDGEEWVIMHLYNNMSDPHDMFSNLGKVMAPRVIYAWAAMRRLCDMLFGVREETRGDKG